MVFLFGNDDDFIIFRVVINKMIKEIFFNVWVVNDVWELVVNCCIEFIYFIFFEVNEICNKLEKKIILLEYVI